MQSLFIHGSWRQFWGSLRFDAVHPPLDYLIDRLLTFLHASDTVLKLPAVAYGVGVVLAMMVLLGRRAGWKAAVAASLLLAAAPFHVRYSQELRPYSLGVFLCVASLLALDVCFARPTVVRVAALFLLTVATAYSLYVAAIALFFAAAAMATEDGFSADPLRRRFARSAWRWSPVFVGAVWVAYLPWLPVVREAARRAPPTTAPEMTVARLSRVLAFYAFAPNDSFPLDAAGFIYIACAVAGLAFAVRRPRLRFLAAWAVGGSLAIEILEHVHPHFFAPRHYIAAAVTIPALAGVAISRLARTNLLRVGAAAALLSLFLAAEAGGLTAYFRDGRPDWRPIADYLRQRPNDEIVVTENQYAQLCVGYYVVGPNFLHLTPEERRRARPIVSLQGDPTPIGWIWTPGRTVWLVLFNGGAQSPALKRWADPYPSLSFPTAEGGTVLKRLSGERLSQPPESAIRRAVIQPGENHARETP